MRYLRFKCASKCSTKVGRQVSTRSEKNRRPAIRLSGKVGRVSEANAAGGRCDCVGWTGLDWTGLVLEVNERVGRCT